MSVSNCCVCLENPCLMVESNFQIRASLSAVLYLLNRMELRGQLQAFAIFVFPNRIECRQEMFAKSCCLVGTCFQLYCSLTWPWYSIMEITTALMMMVREWVWLGKLTMKENKESHFASLPIKRHVVGWLLQLSIGKYHLRKGRKQDWPKLLF